MGLETFQNVTHPIYSIKYRSESEKEKGRLRLQSSDLAHTGEIDNTVEIPTVLALQMEQVRSLD